jgi:hypothetical protein
LARKASEGYKVVLTADRTLMSEYSGGIFLTKSGAKGHGLRFLFSYGSNQAKKLIRKCKEEYYYDLTAMIQDQRNGKISVGPAPIRFIYNYLRQNK